MVSLSFVLVPLYYAYYGQFWRPHFRMDFEIFFEYLEDGDQRGGKELEFVSYK